MDYSGNWYSLYNTKYITRFLSNSNINLKNHRLIVLEGYEKLFITNAYVNSDKPVSKEILVLYYGYVKDKTMILFKNNHDLLLFKLKYDL